MKKNIFISNKLSWIMVLAIVSAAVSCKKYNYLGYTPGTGAPTITSVHTLSKTDTTAQFDTVYTMEASGKTDTTIRGMANKIDPFDSVVVAGNIGQYYVIHGTNLGSATAVYFNNVSVYFNRAWASDNSIIVNIPSTVPTLGSAAIDTLMITTLYGTVRYHFTVLTPPPTINTISDYDFWSGSQITLSGVGFASVTSVGITGTSATATIVSQTDAQIVLQFPSTTVNRANLVFSYQSAGSTATETTTQEFIDLDNATTVFYNNNFQNYWSDNSWSHPSGVSTEATHSIPGTSSLRANYPAGAWQIEGWADWSAPSGGIAYDPAYKYLTFWVKGGTVDHTLVLVGDKLASGYGQVQLSVAPAIQQILVPKGVWTFYKIPLGSGANQLNFWANGSPAQQLGFFLQGQSGDVDEVMYFDEVAFVK